MPFNTRLVLREEDVVRLALEFLDNRELHITQLSLEQETGVINGQYSDDVLLLRQLILDGQWDDVIEFIQPLETYSEFNIKKFSYTILRYKYVELLCIKSEAGGSTTAPGQGVNSMEGAAEEIIQVLEQLEKLAPSKEDYSNLCWLLTFPKLSDHLQFRDWNPSKARVQCFREVYPLVEKYLPHDSNLDSNPSAKNDRLIQLLIKGVLYESCVSFCQSKTAGETRNLNDDICFTKLLDESVSFSDSDLSLLNWLQSIPSETFSVPFEQKTLNVDVERLERPSLETSWTEHMTITPIKPKTFPHSVMPFTRPKSATNVTTRLLIPKLEELPIGLNAATINETLEKNSMPRSSFANFHLTGIKPTIRKVTVPSVDRVFTNESSGIVAGNNHAEFESLPSIPESSEKKLKDLKNTRNPIDSRLNELSQDKTTSTAKSSRRSSLTDKNFVSDPTAHIQAHIVGPKLKKHANNSHKVQSNAQPDCGVNDMKIEHHSSNIQSNMNDKAQPNATRKSSETPSPPPDSEATTKQSRQSISDEKKIMLLQMYESGARIYEAAATLDINPSSAYTIIKRYKADGEKFVEKQWGGNKKSLRTPEVLKAIEEIIENTPSVTLRKIQLGLKNKGMDLSLSVIHRAVKQDLKMTLK